MGVRAKRGRRWPDEYGNYEIVEDKVNGSVLQWVDRGTYGPDTEAVAERILAAINGDTVPAPTLPDDLPSWVSMHATATGADLIEHDPNGEVWERSLEGVRWYSDHAKYANSAFTYLVEDVEKELGERVEKLAMLLRPVGRFVVAMDGGPS